MHYQYFYEGDQRVLTIEYWHGSELVFKVIDTFTLPARGDYVMFHNKFYLVKCVVICYNIPPETSAEEKSVTYKVMLEREYKYNE